MITYNFDVAGQSVSINLADGVTTTSIHQKERFSFVIILT